MELELKEVKLKEIISYSKHKGSPRITVLDSITDDEFREIDRKSTRLNSSHR